MKKINFLKEQEKNIFQKKINTKVPLTHLAHLTKISSSIFKNQRKKNQVGKGRKNTSSSKRRKKTTKKIIS
jgi:hypothetical protein